MVNPIKGRSCFGIFIMLFFVLLCLLASSPVLICFANPQERRASSGAYVIGNGVTAPVVLSQQLPAYTDAARAARIEGIVLLQAIVRKDSTVDSFKIIRGLGYGLDESALNTIATRWRFLPGMLDGQPVDVLVNIELSFRLYDRSEDAERLKDYPLRVLILDAKWDQDSSGKPAGFGHGNLLDGGSFRGFTYVTSCAQRFNKFSNIPAKWIEPKLRLELLNASTASGVCELSVTMQNNFFTLQDGQVVAAEPLRVK